MTDNSLKSPSHLIRLFLFFCLVAELLSVLFLSGCRPEIKPAPSSSAVPPLSYAHKLTGYAIQVGAFSRVSNAVRLTHTLRKDGIEAYYFRHESGLFKVRFGDFGTKEDALNQAERLVRKNIIEEFYIVSPESYSVNLSGAEGEGYLRRSITAAAKNYLGLPYCWGGTSPEEGFDCSGLVMAVYKLNGLNLPRTSREQYKAGIPVSSENLQNGDLVFFATMGGHSVSHVGIFIGKGSFIHAPGRNKKVRTDSLFSGYYRRRYIGARSYVHFSRKP